MEEGIAKTLGWKLGDELTFTVGAERFSAPVTSLRKLRWDSMKINFFVIAPPVLLGEFPASFVSAFRVEPRHEAALNELSQRFPNLTLVDVGAAVRQAQGVIDQLINAVQLVFLFALGAGLLVLYSALVATEDERRREAAVMRVYGASRAQVTGSQRIEFLAMGLVAGVLATLGAAAIGQLLARRVFELDLPPSPELWIAGPLAGVLLLSLNAWLSARKVLTRLPRADAEGLGLESAMADVFLVVIAVAVVAILVLLVPVFLGRNAGQGDARELRRELADGLDRGSKALISQLTAISAVQNNQIDAFSRQLTELVAANERRFQELRESVEARLRAAIEDARGGREESAATLKRFGESLNERFEAIRKDNTEQLERMRVTVDEKLHATLEQRLGESFKLVSERLEAVHKGLGEMQTLAAGVGDLKRVLTNVKTRGTWGEVQLGALLEQMLTREQYEMNVATRPGSRERVEYAVRLPGRDSHSHVWLPIDSKFPIADYELLVAAQERADPVAVEEAARALEARLRLEAKQIREKYVEPPHTTDFAIMFVPTEGLYAEALRRPGLVDALQTEYRVSVVGPIELGRPAEQPADGLPHAGDREALERGVGAAGRSEDGIRAIRRSPGGDQAADRDRGALHRGRRNAHAADGAQAEGGRGSVGGEDQAPVQRGDGRE